MPRAPEPFADALRTARAIVETEAGALLQAAAGADPHACEAARHALVLRIAEAIAEAAETAARSGETA